MLRWLVLGLSITVLCGFMSANDALSVDRSALVAYWSFDKGAGQTVDDDSGNGHEGKIMAKANWAKEGKINGGMSFNSAGAFIDVASDENLDPQEDDWTIELWLKRAESANNDWQVMVANYDIPPGWIGYRLDIGPGSIVNFIFGTGEAAKIELKTVTTIKDTDWHHLAAVAHRDGDALVYIDGEPDDTKMSIKHIKGKKVTAEHNLEIGRCYWCGGGATLGFNGILDEIKLWRAALTQEEVKLSMIGKLGAAVSDEEALPITWGRLKYNMK